MKLLRVVLAPVALLAVVVSSSCAQGLEFRGDHRLGIVTPRDREHVTTPFTVRWTMKGDYDGVFAVFVDRSPMPVGKTLRWVAGDDEGCKRDPRCPDADYLAQRNVFVTAGHSVTVPLLPKPAAGVGDAHHDITVILLDKTGKRLNEKAWHRDVLSERPRQ